MKIKLDKNAKMPTRAHAFDAGLDIYAREGKIINANSSAVFDTGVHIEIPAGYAGFLKSKSGLNVKHGITSGGVIDCGYTGSIVAKLYNNSGDDYMILLGRLAEYKYYDMADTIKSAFCALEEQKRL